MVKAIRKSIGGARPGAGRPATGAEPVRTLRLSDEFVAKVDDWAAKQPDLPKRAEAIRRLVELGLTVKPAKAHSSSKAAARAAELASKVIDERIAADAPEDERVTRKQRLLKGPTTFRDVRKDRPK